MLLFFTIFVRAIFCRKRPDNVSSPPPKKMGKLGAVLKSEMYNTQGGKATTALKIYFLIYNAVTVIITWVDG